MVRADLQASESCGGSAAMQKVDRAFRDLFAVHGPALVLISATLLQRGRETALIFWKRLAGAIW